jgi:hypothetical protein
MELTYLIECKRTGVIKIGKSTNPVNRLKQIKTSNPFVELFGVSNNNEKEFHNYYKDFNIGGEWFEIKDSSIRNELFKKFEPFNESMIKENGEYTDIIKRSNELWEGEFDFDKIKAFDDEVRNKLGEKKYLTLYRNCEEFSRVVTQLVYFYL